MTYQTKWGPLTVFLHPAGLQTFQQVEDMGYHAWPPNASVCGEPEGDTHIPVGPALWERLETLAQDFESKARGLHDAHCPFCGRGDDE